MKPIKNTSQKHTSTKSARRNWQPLGTAAHVQIVASMVVGDWVKMNHNTQQKKSQLLLP